MTIRAEDVAALHRGPYELLIELAAGGMATVYVARHRGTAGFERLVVIKRVHPHLQKQEEFRTMFREEAQVASVLQHTNVSRLLDVIDAEGELFIVLEYIESVALSALERAARTALAPLPVPVVARIICDALTGLEAAHEARDVRGKHLEIVHRDVSPENILVGTDGVSRLIDFGIAKAATRLTATTGGVVKGKFAYMSPEQAKAATVDRRSDLFSMGAVLFEAIAGRRVFDSATNDPSKVLLDILLAPIPDLSSIAPSVPLGLDAVLQTALARPRSERFQDARSFQDALSAVVAPASSREVAGVVEKLCGGIVEQRRTDLRRAMENRTLRPSEAPPPASRPAPEDASVVEARSVEKPRAEASADSSLGHAVRTLPWVRGRRTTVGSLALVVAVTGIAFLLQRPKQAPGVSESTVAPSLLAPPLLAPPLLTPPLLASMQPNPVDGATLFEAGRAPARPTGRSPRVPSGRRPAHVAPSSSAALPARSPRPSVPPQGEPEYHPDNPY